MLFRSEIRWTRPSPGDVIEFPESMQGRYPIGDNEWRTRLCNINKETNRIHVCANWGQAFWNDDGTVDVSGGSWYSMPIEMLKPKYELALVKMWNWGDHARGAGNGVEYTIARPVFIAKCHPNDTIARHALSEEHARKGGQFNHQPIPDDWGLMKEIGRAHV